MNFAWLERTYEPSLGAIRDARWHSVNFLVDVLAGPDDAIERVLDDTRLVVSELFTNAVRAKPSAVTLSVTAQPDTVRIGVIDTADGLPEPHRPDPRADHGRGLHIVDQIAQRWGTVVLPTGKEVWAECPLAADVIPVRWTNPSTAVSRDSASTHLAS